MVRGKFRMKFNGLTEALLHEARNLPVVLLARAPQQ
jgi:hypothetical protein